MSAYLLHISYVLLALALMLALIRFARGPYFLDRVIIFDIVALVMATGAVVFAITERQPYYVDIALVIGFLAFVGSVALAYYWEKNDD